MTVMALRTLAALLALLIVTAPGPARAQDSETHAPSTDALTAEARSKAFNELPPRYRQWVESVIGLISQQELDYFLRLTEDYRRDAFMEAFWEPRDPDPQTPRNELRERWDQYRRNAGGGALPYGDPRFLLLLFNGPPGGWNLPDGQPAARCFSRTRELEIWFYGDSERTTQQFPVILFRRSFETPYEVYHLGDRVSPVLRRDHLPSTDIRTLCADELLGYATSEMARIGNYEQLLEKVLAPPLPPPEWLASFSASATDLPRGAETFSVAAEIDHPARNQSRTAVRVLLRVPLVAAPGRRFDGQLFHHFRLAGEIVRDGKLFESFRYLFEGPTPEDAAAVPLGFTRYLRPGPAELRILLEDVYTGRYAQVVTEVDVPSPEGLPAAPGPSLTADQRPAGPSLRLVPPPGHVFAGKVRFNARADGDFDKVTFYLDGNPVFSKRSPPYSVELDLGEAPEPHRVRVVGLVGGREAATDQIWLNQGSMRFQVRLVEPRPGGIYPGTVTARAEVDAPEGEPPARVELFIGDERVATFTEPPYVKGLELAGTGAAVVRAVAYLADGSWTDDAVVINAAGFTEEVEVRLVELPVLVTDAAGRPVRGLGRERFHVFEEGVEQTIERFEEAGDRPLAAALLIDRSVSMAPHLEPVRDAALAFARDAMRTPEDRLAVFSFAADFTVDAGFTARAGDVERALAGLVAADRTALWDSVVQALQQFGEGPGAPALVLFTDGRDETSRLTYEQVLETARGSQVTVYAIGLAASFPDRESRRELEELAAATGGRASFVAGLDELAGVYAGVLEELRARYLVAYQPAGEASGYRSVEVKVDVEGTRVRTRRGYR